MVTSKEILAASVGGSFVLLVCIIGGVLEGTSADVGIGFMMGSVYGAFVMLYSRSKEVPK